MPRFAFRSIVRSFVLMLVILIPIVIGFTAGVLYAIGVRVVLAVREAFADGQRLING